MKQAVLYEESIPQLSVEPPTSGGLKSTPPRYDLSPDELAAIESRLVTEVGNELGDVFAAAWVGPNHEYANFLRTYEARYFPEVADVDADDEASTMFLALVDNRPETRRVVHGATVMKWSGEIDLSQPINDEMRTGFYTVDSLIDLGNFTPKEFVEYYSENGVDLTRSLAVETNFIILRGAKRYNGLRGAQLTYVTVVDALEQGGAEAGSSAVFATINTQQQLSFNRYGLSYEPLMGRQDMATEEGELGKFSLPVCIPYDADSQAVLKGYGVELPSVTFL